jgi:NADH dehydrogenase FAD-containing subunit
MKRIVLLGGGHAHVHVLQALAREPIAGAELLLVTPFARQMYSGMVPGLVAGHYAVDQCVIPLAPLAQAARRAAARDAGRGPGCRPTRAAPGRRRAIGYDLLSLDTGSVMDRDRIPGAREHGLFVRPIEHFVRLLDPLLALARERVLDVVVVGGGAAGVELAMALQHRLAGQGDERARVALVTGGPPPLAGYPQTVIERGLKALAARRITVFQDSCARIEAGALHLGSGRPPGLRRAGHRHRRRCTALPADSGLQLDERGFVLTGATLQSLSATPRCWPPATWPRAPMRRTRAAASMPCAPARRWLPTCVPWPPAAATAAPPQPRTLNLLSCGSRAIASWGGWSTQGRWVWWWKDRIDRAFIARYAPPAGGGLPGGAA